VAPVAPQQRRQDDPPRANRLRGEISSGTSSVTNLKFTTHHRPIWELEDSPAIRHLQANVCVAAAQIEERGPGSSRSAASSYSRSRSERPCQRRRSQGPCRMDLLEPTTSVGTRTDYSVGPWDYPTCAAWHLMA
jgi:hypothetical protein